MDKVDSKSLDLTKDNIDKLKDLFPNVITEGKIDFDALRLVLGDEVDTSKEKYQFTWNGKAEAIKLAQTPSTSTLRPCIKKSKDWKNTDNLYIEGDNLEVLKQLQKTYYGKIKMIYIDPPYNTGNDFIYNDSFEDSIANYKGQTEQGMSSNPESEGKYHTKWLNNIYPRLILSKNLLSDEGVIFISIDDHEVVNLRKICDEIFGERNFLVEFPRITKKGGKSTDTFAKNHDYLLTYCKNISTVKIRGIEHIDDGFKNVDDFFEKRGPYKLNQTLDYNTLGYVSSLDYPITINGKIFYAGNVTEEEYIKRKKSNPKDGYRWRWSKDLFEFGLNNDFIEVGSSGRIYTKTYLNATIDKVNSNYEVIYMKRTKPISSIEFLDNKYSNDNSNKEITNLLGKGIFDYVKPTNLLQLLMKSCLENDDYILDFFSGSATTAHAVMKLNAEDNGNRKFIMVQLPEKCDEKSEAYKDGYKTICDIGEERIRRAGDEIKQKWLEENQGEGLFAKEKEFPFDIGFKVFKLDSTNIKLWDSELKLDENTIYNQDEIIKGDRSSEDVLYEVMLKYGIFNQQASSIEINGKIMYKVGKRYMIVCLDDNITNEDVKAIGELKPKNVVFKENGFKDDNDKINAVYNLTRAGVEEIKCI